MSENSSEVTLQNVILSHPHLTEPWAHDPSHTKKYSAEYIFLDEASMQPALHAIAAANAEAVKKGFWGSGIEPLMPWKQVKKGPYEGLWSFSAKDAKFAPDIVGLPPERAPIVDMRQVFAGCKVHAAVRFFGTTTGGSPRIAVGLGPIMIVDSSDNMVRLGSEGMSVEDAFKGVEGSPAPLASVGGAAPQSGPAATGMPQAAATPPGLSDPLAS